MKPEREQEETKQSRWGFRGKTVWDWMDLLLVPLLLGILAVGLTAWFNGQQDARQNRFETQRAEAEAEVAEQRAQDEALQAYLNQMSQLMLDRKLLKAEPGDPVYTLAQARTSTALARLDAKHNRNVARFLTDSGLTGSKSSSISLLKDIELPQGVKLRGADLGGADLRGANLTGVNLRKANLNEANLQDANLRETDLRDATLSGATLPNANLQEANLQEANLQDAEMSKADLSKADLSEADLSGTSLVLYSDLRGTGLEEAKLYGADLSKANLGQANLLLAQGVTKEQVEEQAKTPEGDPMLEGATMPDGSTYPFTAPKVKSTVPKSDATGASPTANVKATFSERMDNPTINDQTFTLRKQGSTNILAAKVTYDHYFDRDTAILDPTHSLKRGATYKASVTNVVEQTLSRGAQDISGHILDQNSSSNLLESKEWTFKVEN